ncbi:MAG TPA: SpoIIE family protein phosphatase [Candidatus Elarobacter sp.]|nr:SpoIIE family protein phosphatase [Candidatus Elarobacter sp.]
MQALLLSIVPLAFLLALLVIAWVLQNKTEQTTAWSARATTALNASDRILATLTVASRDLQAYTKKPSSATLAAYHKSIALMPAETRDLQSLVAAEPTLKPKADQYAALTTQIVDIVNRYLGYLVAHQKKKATAYAASPRVRTIGTTWTNAKSAFDQAERELTLRRLSALQRDIEWLMRLLVACALVGILISLFIAGRFGLRIVRRLQRLADNAHRLGAGEEPQTIDGTDEIARLDTVYRDMALRIRQTSSEREEALEAYRREHVVASTLQHAMLPHKLPQVAGLRIDTAYVPAAGGTEIGGDWYDVFEVSRRLVGISVGDVAGHGLRAATVMGAVRQSIRTAARDDDEPSSIMRRVNRVLCADEGTSVVTAFFGLLDLRTGTLRYALAGHPPPMVVRPGKRVELLPGEGFVLGVDPRIRFQTFESELDVGAGLVLYTDGLVEAERDYFKGMRLLEEASVAECRDPSINIAEGIQHRVFAHAAPRDDSALLFIGVTGLSAEPPSPERQGWRLDARDEVSAHRVKRALLWQLGGFASSDADLGTIEAIFGELLSNVKRHTPGPADVTLERGSEGAVLSFDDDGPPFSINGHSPPDLLAESGRGLFMLRALARDVSVERIGARNHVAVALPLEPD